MNEEQVAAKLQELEARVAKLEACCNKPEADELPEGVVGMAGTLVFPCTRCGRSQAYSPDGRAGGVSQQEAEWLGWVRLPDGWICPQCAKELAGPGLAEELEAAVEELAPVNAPDPDTD